MSALSRREFFVGAAGIGAGALLSHLASRHWLFNYTEAGVEYVLREREADIERRLLPGEGKILPVAFDGSMKRLVEAGVIDVDKWNKLYAGRKQEVPGWVERTLRAETRDPIRIDPDSAPFLLNLLWALGLSNKTNFNQESPVNGKRLSRFASTAGWKLGREKNGAAYFNTVANVVLDDEQERLVYGMAENIFRPCCNNSTLFQDCNPGSAMLGMLELGASQGRSEQELYAAALIANAYWFPTKYAKIALYYEDVVKRPFSDVPPRDVLSRRVSSSSGLRGNVVRKLAEANLLSRSSGSRSGGCSV
jgi:hypothetical protein